MHVAAESGGEGAGIWSFLKEHLLDRVVAGHDARAAGEVVDALADGFVEDAGAEFEVGLGLTEGVGGVGARDEDVSGGESGEQKAEDEG